MSNNFVDEIERLSKRYNPSSENSSKSQDICSIIERCYEELSSIIEDQENTISDLNDKIDTLERENSFLEKKIERMESE